jgi:hypothetical protein
MPSRATIPATQLDKRNGKQKGITRREPADALLYDPKFSRTLQTSNEASAGDVPP